MSEAQKRKLPAMIVAMLCICAMLGLCFWMLSGFFQPGPHPIAISTSAPEKNRREPPPPPSPAQMVKDAASRIVLAVMIAPDADKPVPPTIIVATPAVNVTNDGQQQAIELQRMKKDAAMRLQLAVIPKPRR